MNTSHTPALRDCHDTNDWAGKGEWDPLEPRAARYFVSGIAGISASPMANSRVKGSTCSLPGTRRADPGLHPRRLLANDPTDERAV